MADLTIIAAIALGGVIGRTSKLCDDCCATPGCSTCAVPCAVCNTCDESGRVPCNDMPWSYPEHDARVEALTMGHAVIMGRRDWESLSLAKRRKGGLPGRRNIVVSRSMLDDFISDDVRNVPFSLVGTLNAALFVAERDGLMPFVIGGALLFAEALPLATTLELTLIGREYEGDVLFPGWHMGADIQLRGDRLRLPLGEGPTKTPILSFECVSRTPGTHPDLTFTTWKRSAR